MTIATTVSTITDHEAAQVERANASSATPVVFVHGLWLLPSSWDRWVTLFEEAGYVGVTPGWPDDPETVAEAREHPEVFAGKGISEIANYEEAIIRRLDRKPVIIGHSFGGLLTMILAGRGLAAASVAISPAPFRGVLPLPIAALRSASVALRNPANWNRAVPLSYEQFRYSFANAVGEDEAKELYLGYSVAGAGEPLFQAASANLNPWTEAKVDSTNPERGPMLIVSADSDQTVPWAIANAAYKKQKRNEGVTEIVKMTGPRARADDRRRLAGGRPEGARVRQAVHISQANHSGDKTMSTITTNDGTTIYYKDWGAGPVVTFSHGWPLNSDMWDGPMLFLAQHGFRSWRTIVVAMADPARRGSGNDMDGYADDLAAVVEALDLKDITMVGHSTGGGEVARYIGRYGTKRVVKAVLIAAVPPIMLKSAANPEDSPWTSSTACGAPGQGPLAGVQGLRSPVLWRQQTWRAGVARHAGSVLALEHAGGAQELVRQHQGLF